MNALPEDPTTRLGMDSVRITEDFHRSERARYVRAAERCSIRLDQVQTLSRMSPWFARRCVRSIRFLVRRGASLRRLATFHGYRAHFWLCVYIYTVGNQTHITRELPYPLPAHADAHYPPERLELPPAAPSPAQELRDQRLHMRTTPW